MRGKGSVPVFDRALYERLCQRVRDGRLPPDYGGACFSEIPGAVRHLLRLQDDSPLADIMAGAGVTPRGTEKVIVLLLDGFGYRQWEKNVDRHAFLGRIAERGTVAPLSSVFPATTAAALTTIHTGLTPQEHGLLEWMVYDSDLDRNIYTLPFTEIVTQESLVGKVDPDLLFDGETVYERLGAAGVPSYTFTNASIAHSPYAKRLMRGSTPVPYKTASDLVVNLRRHLALSNRGPAYFYVYWDLIDSISHLYGPDSEQYLAELDSFFHLLRTQLMEALPAESARGVSLLVTADHGHIRIRPGETIFLNDFPAVTRHFRRAANGQPILPWGSARDCFLAIEPDKIDEVHHLLERLLAGRATVLRSEAAIRNGLFGRHRPHQRFRVRAGDLIILPHDTQTVWYQHEPGPRKFTKLGHHGGLTPDETLVPFGCIRLADLVAK